MKIKKIAGILATGTAVYYGLLSSQQRQDCHGVYRSVINSSRAGLILYRAVKDYEVSLFGLQYNSQAYHAARHEVHMRVAESILELSKANRGIYLKLGQYLGNLEKVVPWEFTHVLKVLQDSAPPLPYEEMKVVIETDLHANPEQLFSHIDPTPIAAASLAQVHKATLAATGEQVAIKIQYPFLQTQSKWDLRVLSKITQFCSYLLKKHRNNDLDLLKLFTTWTGTLVEELDFNIELRHALKTKQLFADYPYLYIPKYYQNLCSQRLLVMQFVSGCKINQKQQIINQSINPSYVANNLLDIFTMMIFKHGFVHCDAHPGNILVRKQANSLGHDIVLLDHGLYREISPTTVRSFSGLWISLMLQKRKQVQQYAKELNIHDHLEYLPIIFLHRTINSRKKIGADITQQEKQYFREKDLSNFDSINHILQDLPPQLMFIIRASNLVGSHNQSLGGSNRDRYFYFTSRAMQILYPGRLNLIWQSIFFALRLWLFELSPTLYSSIFGTLDITSSNL